MKTWIKFLVYLVVGLSSITTMGVGLILIFEREILAANTFAGIACLLCSIPACVWVMYKGFNLDRW